MTKTQNTNLATYKTDKIHLAHTGSEIQGHQHQIIIQRTQNIPANTKKYSREAGEKHAKQDKHSMLPTTHC